MALPQGEWGGRRRGHSFRVRDERKRKALAGIGCEDNTRPGEKGAGDLNARYRPQGRAQVGQWRAGEGRSGQKWISVTRARQNSVDLNIRENFSGYLAAPPGTAANISSRSALLVSSFPCQSSPVRAVHYQSRVHLCATEHDVLISINIYVIESQTRHSCVYLARASEQQPCASLPWHLSYNCCATYLRALHLSSAVGLGHRIRTL